MQVETSNLNKWKWKQYTITNDNGISVRFLNYGGIITEIRTPDRDGNIENIVLGFRDYADYKNNPNYFGALIGRVAGRIHGAAIEVDGKQYSLDKNEGTNHLHGGNNGFNQVIWEGKAFENESAAGVKLSHLSPDGESGYPGNIEAEVTYTLNNDNQFIIDYAVTADHSTPIALTNHSYFNLSGDLKDTVHNHFVTVDSGRFLELDENLIATGNSIDVQDSSFDFREGRLLSDGFSDQTDQNKIAGNGYDHYFIFEHKNENNVTVVEENSGRVLTIQTNQPGMVMFTANTLNEEIELAEGPSKPYLGVCFETQGSPASLHHEEFPGIMLKSGETYQKQTIFSFDVEN